MKWICSCGAAIEPHPDEDGSWKMLEKHHRMCGFGQYGWVNPVEVDDDFVRDDSQFDRIKYREDWNHEDQDAR